MNIIFFLAIIGIFVYPYYNEASAKMQAKTARATGLDRPRTRSVLGSALPSPRAVSMGVHTTVAVQDPKHTHMLMQWGQFLDHDITLTPVPDESSNNCSDCNSKNPDCFPIMIPPGDNVFEPGSCMPLVRSTNVQMKPSEPRTQINQITSYMDASNVYGSEIEVSESLRLLTGGKLKTTGDTLLPEDTVQDGCSSPNPDKKCFLAGDARSNEQMGLTSMHTLWVRTHNKIAEDLQTLNPNWRNDDKCLYLETRRIIGALHQRITYNEFLPTILSREILESYGILEEKQADNFYGHNRYCDPTITNEFATAAFRFGHSLIDALMQVKLNGSSMTPHDLRFNFFNPVFLHQDPQHVLGMLIGASGQQCMQMDSHIDDIDLFTGVVSERNSAANGMLGDVGQHILAEQFKRLKHCDRFFYSNHKTDITPGAFTTDQLRSIRNMKLANVMCTFMHSSTKIQEFTMRMSDQTDNPIRTCADFPPIDLTPWRSNSACSSKGLSTDYVTQFENKGDTCFVERGVCPARCIPEGPYQVDFGAILGEQGNHTTSTTTGVPEITTPSATSTTTGVPEITTPSGQVVTKAMCDKMNGRWSDTTKSCFKYFYHSLSWQHANDLCNREAPQGANGRLAVIPGVHVYNIIKSMVTAQREHPK